MTSSLYQHGNLDYAFLRINRIPQIYLSLCIRTYTQKIRLDREKVLTLPKPVRILKKEIQNINPM